LIVGQKTNNGGIMVVGRSSPRINFLLYGPKLGVKKKFGTKFQKHFKILRNVIEIGVEVRHPIK